MNYTFFAIGCYIVMRGFQVLFEEQSKKIWFKAIIKVVALITLYAALASLIVWYKDIPFLGFGAGS